MTRLKRPNGLTSLTLLAFSGLCFAAACSSGSDSHSAPISMGASGGSSGADSGGSGGTHHGSSGGSSAAGGNASSGASGEAGQAGLAGLSSDGGAAGSQPGTVIDVTPGTCTETPNWTGSAQLPVVSTAAVERLLSITADELDIAFLRDGALYVAHRGSPSAAFGAPAAVTLPAGYAADAGAALSADALTLVLVSADGQSFGALTRAARSTDFGAVVDQTAFLALNERAVQTLEHYAAPVLAPNGKSFVFAAFTPPAPSGSAGDTGAPVGAGDGVSLVYESPWSGNQWAMPRSISQYLFDGTSAARPLPSGLSSDSRTLFYFDEGSSKEIARFRDRPDAPLYDSIDLGDLQGAIPNSKCDRVYFSSSGDVATETD